MPDWCSYLPLDTITVVSTRFYLDKWLIAAIVSTESGGEESATRYEPHFKWILDPEDYARKLATTVQTEAVHQKTSWGLMQVMGAVARELGHIGYMPELCIPEIGLEFGCIKMRELIKKYGRVDDAVSAYNQGAPRKFDNGQYRNQYYVDRVLDKYEQITGAM